MDIEDCVAQFEEVFKGQPWYGPPFLKSLEQIEVRFWNRKWNNNGHSIAELLFHMLDWRLFVIQKLKDNDLYRIEMNTESDWRRGVSIETEKQKNEIINQLKDTQQDIIQLLSKKPDSWLNEFVIGKDYKNSYMIQGAIQHDIYHLGQINLLHNQLKNE